MAVASSWASLNEPAKTLRFNFMFCHHAAFNTAAASNGATEPCERRFTRNIGDEWIWTQLTVD